MRFKFTIFFEYLIKLLKTWIVVLAFVPWVYDLIYVYLPEPLNTYYLPRWFILIFTGTAFFIAGFLVWRKEKNRVTECEAKLHTGIKYTITYTEELVRTIETKSIQNEIQTLESTKDRADEISLLEARLSNLSNKARLKDLKIYLQEANEYNKKIKGMKEIVLRISNTGTKYDEYINVKITPTKNTIILNKEESLEIEYPPEKTRWLSPPIIPPNPGETEGFSRQVEYNEDGTIDVEINKLRVNEEVNLIYEGIYLTSDNFCFDCEIKSKGLRETQQITITN